MCNLLIMTKIEDNILAKYFIMLLGVQFKFQNNCHILVQMCIYKN